MHRSFILPVVLSMACSSAYGRAPAPTHAVTCVAGVVRNDTELARYQGCSEVSGDLEVSGVTSLEPLDSLRSVEGTLSIEHTSRLYSLAGLERLRSVGTLEIRDNAALIYGGALRNLGQARRVSVSDNPRLSREQGFVDGIRRAAASVDFSRNWGLAAQGVTQSQHGAIAAR